MTVEGTVVNGAIVLDGGAKHPEGARVQIEVTGDADCHPPPEPYDRAQELAILREALEDVKTGRGMPFEEFMAKLAAELDLPAVPPE